MNILTLDKYSDDIGISIHELKGTSRIPEIALAREVYWYYLRKKEYTLDRIGLMFDRKRSTILSGVRTIDNMIQTNNSCINDYLNALDLFFHQESSL